jgi:hypothetical protein
VILGEIDLERFLTKKEILQPGISILTAKKSDIDQPLGKCRRRLRRVWWRLPALGPRFFARLELELQIFLYLNDPPCPGAILFVVARALVHNQRSVATPGWRILIIEIESAFRSGRECTEGHTFRKIEGKYLF